MDNQENDQIPYPLPQPTVFTKPFWDACQQGSLEVSICHACKHLFLPGGPVCPSCWSSDLGTKPVSGRGNVFSFVIYRRTYHPAIPSPYVVALIDLDEGVRIVSNVVGCEPESVSIGMSVQVVFEETSGFLLPRFIPAGDSSTPTVSPTATSNEKE